MDSGGVGLRPVDSSISQNQSTGLIQFAGGTVLLGNEQHTLQNTTIRLSPPASGNMVSVVQATTIVAVPEPASVALLGTGLVTLLGTTLSRRRA